jgi:guanylate kinase
MKVELTPIPPKEKPFEPFSVTFTFETEQEACNMWHRLNQAHSNFRCSNDKVRHLINNDGSDEAFEIFNRIMFEKRLSSHKPKS